MPDHATVSTFQPYQAHEIAQINAKLNSAYADAERRLLAVLTRKDITSWRRAYTIQQLAQIEAITAGLDQTADLWAAENVPALYKHGMWIADGYLQPGGLSVAAHPGQWTPMDLGMTRLHDVAVRNLAENAALKLTEANAYCAQRIESMVGRAQNMAQLAGKGRAFPAGMTELDYLRETAEGQLQLRIRDASLSAMQDAFIEGQTHRQASQAFLEQLRRRGITSFVDRAGRQWDMATYADMVTDTVASEAQRHGMQERLVEWGDDLVDVSGAITSDSCKVCRKYAGKTLSIRGKTPGYVTVDEATAEGLFHPHCAHLLTPHVEADAPAPRATPTARQEIPEQREVSALIA